VVPLVTGGVTPVTGGGVKLKPKAMLLMQDIKAKTKINGNNFI